MRSRHARTAVGALSLALLLTACGGDKEQTVPGDNIATVAGAGRTLEIGADAQRGKYPKVCPLLPDNSVAALLGGPASATSTVSGCAWSTGRSNYPSLNVTWMQLGSDAEDSYEQKPSGVSDLRTLDGVGDRARTFRIESDKNENKIIAVDVLKDNAFFRVQVLLVTTSANDLDTAQQIANRTAQLIAQQIS